MDKGGMKTDRRIVNVVVLAGIMAWTSMSMGEGPSAVRLEPKPGKYDGDAIPERIPWKDLQKGRVNLESSIMTEGYLPQALVLEKLSDPSSVKLQWRVKGAWYWMNEEGAYALDGVPVHTSEWVNLHVAPEGWVLLPAYALLEEAAGYAEPPGVEEIIKVLKRDYPSDESGVGMAKSFADLVKSKGKESVMQEVVYILKEIEIRFAERGKEFPEKAQLVIHIEPGC